MLKCVLPDWPAWNEFRAVKKTLSVMTQLSISSSCIFVEHFSLLSGAHIQRNASIMPTLS